MPGVARRGRITHSQVMRGVRRKTFWIGTADVGSLTNLAADAKAIVNSFTGAQVSAFAPYTIVRTVGNILIQSDQVVGSEVASIAYGQMIVTELARAAGAASVPGPMTDMADDMWYTHLLGFSNFRFLTAAGFESAAGRIYQFDSRAQRKVEDGMADISMLETRNVGVQFWTNHRQLIKLH